MSEESAQETAQTPLAPVAWVGDIALRWGDMDPFRHINNVQIARLYEEARVRAFRAWFDGPRPDGLGVVVARHEIEYTSVLHYSEAPARCEVWVTRVGNKSYDVGCRLLAADGTVAALCETTCTVVDLKTGRSVEMTPAYRSAIESKLGAPVPFRRRS